MGGNEVIVKFMWFHDLSNEDRLAEIKKDNTLCTIVYLFEKEMDEPCVKLCETVQKFNEL